jgi:MoaA/NifB/PqqE/SkfB family radical SAM enzyme
MKKIRIKKYSPFNPLKVLKHVEYWQDIPDKIPPPLFVTVDPINVCNFNCIYCNSLTVRNKNIEMDREYLRYLAGFIADWGVKAVCIAGGGEPLLNKNLPLFLDECRNKKLETAIVTNGSMLNQFLYPHLVDCVWIGISIDAARDETLRRLKGTPKGMFERILQNIKGFIEYRDDHDSRPQVTYKFLIHPYNYNEILLAAKTAKDIGCDLIHLRPAGTAWFDLNGGSDMNITFTEAMIDLANSQIDEAKRLYEDENFQIYDTMYKFTDQWKPNVSYERCYALYTNCYFSPDKKIRLCCDRRGDPMFELGDVPAIEDVNRVWGSDRHKDIANSIDVSKCPRCTYAHINEVFENVILEDRMMCNFI